MDLAVRVDPHACMRQDPTDTADPASARRVETHDRAALTETVAFVNRETADDRRASNAGATTAPPTATKRSDAGGDQPRAEASTSRRSSSGARPCCPATVASASRAAAARPDPTSQCRSTLTAALRTARPQAMAPAHRRHSPAASPAAADTGAYAAPTERSHRPATGQRFRGAMPTGTRPWARLCFRMCR